ncbi:MAG TPA: peptidase T [Gaiella sp.]|nr:peptidase T [Gaiella sp.]
MAEAASRPDESRYASPLAAELAEDVLERFLRYVVIDTQASVESTGYPSSAKQLDLSRVLVDELRVIGLEDAELTEHGYVFATLPGTVDDAPTVGLIAHVDTAPDEPGTGVTPIVHRAYTGGPIRLPGDPGQVLDPAELPALAERIGHDIVTSDGTTLLGADDKAGVAEIVSAIAYLARDAAPRATARIAFTVDEEVGRGTDHFDLERFGADFAYTFDGSGLGEVETETFSADQLKLTIRGVGVHPGTAKGRLVNAIKLLSDVVAALPRDRLSPETTEGREGFVHPARIAGSTSSATLWFIARDHDDEKLAEHVEVVRSLAAEVVSREPHAAFELEVEPQYRNMRRALDRHPEIVAAAETAIRRAGVEPVPSIIRGGTDGARLTEKGLPTPNLFTGGQDYHSLREWASVQDMAAAAATAVELVRLWGEPAQLRRAG